MKLICIQSKNATLSFYGNGFTAKQKRKEREEEETRGKEEKTDTDFPSSHCSAHTTAVK